MVEFQRKDFYSYEDFLEIMRLLRAPGGCPWDREQTHQSIRRGMLEEAYEVLGAIQEGDPFHMAEEFGDLLLKIALHAVIGEELGMIACILVIMLLLIIIIRCVMVGIRSGSNMGSLVCFGVAAFLTFQTFENIGMCIGITPVIGITLPFFSYGGSSLFTTFAALGMVSGIHFRPRPKRNSIYY